ncbi:LTA synthase family protein [Ensifer soli]|uniref:LTA synthase family protein n=1 Tax=Ciceribacter sp. sgz301302 TaxID=3342379 RepID=UPI0035BA8EA4
MAGVDSLAVPSTHRLGAEGFSLDVRVARLPGLFKHLALTLLMAAALVATIELITRASLSETVAYVLDPMRPATTAIGLVFLVLIAFDALFGRRHMGVLVLAPFAVIPALISKQKQIFLSDPLYPTDLLFGRQIVELLPAMVRDRPGTAIAIAVGLVAGVALLTFALRHAWRRFARIGLQGRLVRLAVALPLIAGFVSIMDYNQFSWLRDRLRVIPIMWDQTENYRHNGFLLAFSINVPMANVSTPSGYSLDAIERIASEPLPAGTTHRMKPDVIVLMSESLFDPTRLPNVTLEPDPMPTIRAMQGGNVFSPEFGGMTSNVEFEALTGFSNAFLPYGSIPYQQYIRESLPSLATFFRGEGYVSRAIHPFQKWFWNRGSVYQSFGFDAFASEETMPPMVKRGIFASDESLTGEIIRQADILDDPFFFFAVTLQGHGPYEANRYAHNTIKVTGDLPQADRQVLETYAQGVKEADDNLRRLMDWARERDRETIIVIFGDHLPPLNTVYTSTGFMPQVTASRKGSLDEMKIQHETPLVVWSNKTGARKDIGTISPAFLSYQILKTAGYEHPYYTGFLGTVFERFPVIDRYMLIDRRGRETVDWLRRPKIVSTIRDYRFLQHDMMFGKRHGIDRFFRPQDLPHLPQT